MRLLELLLYGNGFNGSNSSNPDTLSSVADFERDQQVLEEFCHQQQQQEQQQCQLQQQKRQQYS